MAILTRLEPYTDDDGNEVRYAGTPVDGVRIKFTGRNNTLVVARRARIGTLRIDFDNDGGTVSIGASSGVPAFSAAIRVGQDSTVRIGANVSTTSIVAMSAVESTTIRVGDDVMFASENEVRADDGHPIFDVRTRLRVNTARSITIGDHVWVARRAVLLGGAKIGPGSVVGYGSIVTRKFPNNVVVAGSLARVVRRDVAWERPHLSLVQPIPKHDASTVAVSEKFWNLTVDPTPARRSTGLRALLGRVRRALRRSAGRG